MQTFKVRKRMEKAAKSSKSFDEFFKKILKSKTISGTPITLFANDVLQGKGLQAFYEETKYGQELSAGGRLN